MQKYRDAKHRKQKNSLGAPKNIESGGNGQCRAQEDQRHIGSRGRANGTRVGEMDLDTHLVQADPKKIEEVMCGTHAM